MNTDGERDEAEQMLRKCIRSSDDEENALFEVKNTMARWEVFLVRAVQGQTCK